MNGIDPVDDPSTFQLETQTAAEAAEAAQALSGDRVATTAWPKTLVELVDVMSATMIRRGAPAETAEVEARHLVAAIALHNGGRPVYLPRGQALETALMHDAIYRAHRRGNTEALARQYGLTTRAVQMIVRQQSLLHRRRIQPELLLGAARHD